MAKWAMIGGTGFRYQKEVVIRSKQTVTTAYGAPSSPLSYGVYKGKEIIFLDRHGENHQIPPHKVNYRANISALQQAGVTHIIGLAAVGGITSSMAPQVIAVPDQVIDYTWGREQTFFNEFSDNLGHIDFTEPYCEHLRQALVAQGDRLNIPLVSHATYGATQGPRLESAAEIQRMQQDGCDLVGMTGMPEVALAKELGLCYAHCAVVANWAAGKSEGVITMDDIEMNLAKSIKSAEQLILATMLFDARS